MAGTPPRRRPKPTTYNPPSLPPIIIVSDTGSGGYNLTQHQNLSGIMSSYNPRREHTVSFIVIGTVLVVSVIIAAAAIAIGVNIHKKERRIEQEMNDSEASMNEQSVSAGPDGVVYNSIPLDAYVTLPAQFEEYLGISSHNYSNQVSTDRLVPTYNTKLQYIQSKSTHSS